jgi:hypothetical protein
MSYKNKGRRNDGAANGGSVSNADNKKPADPRMAKQTSVVSSSSIQSTNRFAAFGGDEE